MRCSTTNTNREETQCLGFITISHIDDYDYEKSLELGGYRNGYLNLKRGFPILRRNYVVRLETFGDCCWEIYSERKFSGDKQVLWPGGFTNPDFQPASIRRMECNFDKNKTYSLQY